MPVSIALLAFLIFMAVLIAGYFYIYWAKGRDATATRTRDAD